MKLSFWKKSESEPNQQMTKECAVAAKVSESHSADQAAADKDQAPRVVGPSTPTATPATPDEQHVTLTEGDTAVAKPTQIAGQIGDKLRRDRSLYQELLGGLYDAIVVVDPKGTVIVSNPRTGKLFGYDVDDLWDMRCEALVPVMKLPVLTKIRSHAESGRFTIVNAACLRKDGTTFPAEIAINRINLFNEGDLLFSVRSIERRVRAQDNKSIEDLVMHNAAAGIIVCSEEGMLERANPAFINLVGAASENDVIRRFIGDFCISHAAGMGLLLKNPVGASFWIGRLQLLTDKKLTVDVLASAARSEAKQKERIQIVMTFTPIPRMAAVGQATTTAL